MIGYNNFQKSMNGILTLTDGKVIIQNGDISNVDNINANTITADNIIDIQNEIDNHNQNFVNIGNELSNINNVEIPNLQSQITVNTNSINSINTNNINLQIQITTNTNNITDISNNIGTINSSITSINNDISSIEANYLNNIVPGNCYQRDSDQDPEITITKSGTTATIDFGIPRGYRGFTGSKGDKGDTGDKGEKGEKGDRGDQGPSGDSSAATAAAFAAGIEAAAATVAATAAAASASAAATSASSAAASASAAANTAAEFASEYGPKVTELERVNQYQDVVEITNQTIFRSDLVVKSIGGNDIFNFKRGDNKLIINDFEAHAITTSSSITSSGNIKLKDSFNAELITLNASNGTVDVINLNCGNNTTIGNTLQVENKLTAKQNCDVFGDIVLKDLLYENIKLTNSTGTIDVKNINCSNNLTINNDLLCKGDIAIKEYISDITTISMNSTDGSITAKELSVENTATLNNIQLNGNINYTLSGVSQSITKTELHQLNDTLAKDADVVKLTGDQNISGVKTFSNNVIASNDIQLGGNITYTEAGVAHTITKPELNQLNNTLAVDNQVVKLTGDQSISGNKTFTGTTKINTFDTATLGIILSAVYPVGSIYINYNSTTNPSTLLGIGTWSQISSGTFLRANTSGGSIGGSTNHNHIWYNYNSGSTTAKTIDSNEATTGGRVYNVTGSTVNIPSGALNNDYYTNIKEHLPPYLDVIMWRRTA